MSDKINFFMSMMRDQMSTRQAEDEPQSLCDWSHNAVSNFFLTDCNTEGVCKSVQPTPKKGAEDLLGSPPTSPKAAAAEEEQPKKVSPKSPNDKPLQKIKFDYYGNRIEVTEEQTKVHRRPDMTLHEQLPGMNVPTTPRLALPSMNTPTTPRMLSQRMSALTTSRDDYSEFLEATPTPREQPPNTKDADVEEGCISEFGNCLKFSVCGEGYVQEEEQVQAELMMQELNNELQTLRQSSLVDANTTRALVERDLQTELANARQATLDMEACYREEIAREVSERVRLQSELSNRLLNVVHSRMLVQREWDNLGTTNNNNANNATPTNMRMITNQPEKISPLSVSLLSPSSSSLVEGTAVRPVDPPTGATPTNALAVANDEYIKNSTLSKKHTTYGLSIVVEGSGSVSSPTERRSPLAVATPVGQYYPEVRGIQVPE